MHNGQKVNYLLHYDIEKVFVNSQEELRRKHLLFSLLIINTTGNTGNEHFH